MALPTGVQIWEESMDPYDVTDYAVDLASLLESGESISAWTAVVGSEGALYGLTLGSGAYATQLNGTVLTLWLSVQAGFQNDAIYATGVTLPIEISITTSSTPQRKKQRTVAVRVIQK